jgi:hypothetical protein
MDRNEPEQNLCGQINASMELEEFSILVDSKELK